MSAVGRHYSDYLNFVTVGSARPTVLLGVIRKTIFEKPERHEFTTRPELIVRFMSLPAAEVLKKMR